MPDDLFEEIVAQIAPLRDHLTYVGLFMDGEPLLDPDLPRRVARCKEAGLPNVGFTTNAALLTEARARAILDAAPDWVGLSVDSLIPEVYETARIRIRHPRMMENVHRFIDLRTALKKRTRLVVRHIEHPGNVGEFPSYLKYFGQILDNDLDEIGHTVLHNFASGSPRDGGYGSSPCGFLFNRVIIFTDGTVPLCCLDVSGTEAMGNIREQDVLTIFNGPKWRDYLRLHQEGQRHLIPLCAGCDLPDLDKEQKMFVKMTPDGQVFHSNFMQSFDYAEKRGKLVDAG